MIRLPRRIEDIRAIFDVIRWRELASQVEAESRSRLAIIGPVNAGKSSLFNVLQGREISEVSPIPGTTTEAIAESFGPFTLIDTPGLGDVAIDNRLQVTQQTLERSNAVILLLDAVAGIRQTDIQLYHQIKQTGKPVIVALNKVDLIKPRERMMVLNDAEHKLGISVIGISAKTGEGIAEQVMPAIIELNPTIAVAIGRALPAFRRKASERVIREATLMAGGIGLEPIPLLDLPLLVGHQLRMVLRLAAIFGEPFSVQHARELIGTIAGSVTIRFLGQQASKFIPGPGWLVAAGFAAGGTYAIGKAAQAYFESGKQLNAEQLQAIYKRLRKEKTVPEQQKDPTQ
jgi:small GTP-binding protein